MTATVDECVETAREYLPVEVVEQWVEQWKGLLRRGYRLRPLGPGEETAVVCRSAATRECRKTSRGRSGRATAR